MSYLINNQQKINDIIFADRNKSYGAYAIRSTYGNTLLKSLLLMISGMGACMFTAYYLSNHNNVISLNEQIIPVDSIFTMTPVDLTPKEKSATDHIDPVETPPADKQPAAKGGLVNIVDSADVKPTSPDVTEQTAAITTSAMGTSPGTSTGGGGDEKDKKTGGGGGKDKIQQLASVDTPPEFEGGLAALNKFLSQNLKYPLYALDEGKEGTVHVEFVVDENGEVGSLRLQMKQR